MEFVHWLEKLLNSKTCLLVINQSDQTSSCKSSIYSVTSAMYLNNPTTKSERRFALSFFMHIFNMSLTYLHDIEKFQLKL